LSFDPYTPGVTAPPLDDASILGVRALRYVVSNRWTLGVPCLVFGIAAAVAGALKTPTFEQHAVVQIGLRAPNDPIEERLVTAKRLEGYALEWGAKFGPIEAVGTPVIDEDPTRPARLVELRVKAQSSSAAASAVDVAVKRLLAHHESVHRFDLGINEQHIQRIRVELAAIESELAKRPPTDQNKLSAASYAAESDASGFERWLAPSRAPPSKLIAIRKIPDRRGLQTILFALAGGAFGIVVGLFVTIERRASQNERASSRSRRELESVSFEMFEFVRRFRRLLVGATSIGGAAGLLVAASWPETHSARVIVRAAIIPPDGAVEPMEPAAMWLRDRLAYAAEPDAKRAEIQVRVIQQFEPAPVRPSPMFEILATARDPSVSRRAVEKAIALLAASQNVLYQVEYDRIRNQVEGYERELAKRPASGRTAREVNEFLKALRDVSNAQRSMAPSRTNRVETLSGPFVERDSRATHIGASGVLGALVGLIVGGASALLLASLRRA
jgi:hypothetical protein